MKLKIIKSAAPPSTDQPLAFRGYFYLRMPVQFTLSRTEHAVCLDTGATVSVVDTDFLLQERPDI